MSQSGGRRDDVLAALKAATAPMSIVHVADDLHVHPNTVRFHLQALMRDGLVERADPNPSAKALEAGRAWKARLGQPAERDAPGADEAVDRLIDVLDDLGSSQVGLRHCPFLELAEGTSEVICPVHVGLMQGAVQTWGAPVGVDRLDAFVEPDLCLAHLTSGKASS